MATFFLSQITACTRFAASFLSLLILPEHNANSSGISLAPATLLSSLHFRPRGHGKKSSGNGVGGRNKFSAAGTAIDRGYDGRYTRRISFKKQRGCQSSYTARVRENCKRPRRRKGVHPKQRCRGEAPAHPIVSTGVGEGGVRSLQTRMRNIPPSSMGVRCLDPLRSCSATVSGKRDSKSAFPLALPVLYSRV